MSTSRRSSLSATPSRNDYLIKILLIGDSGVGKSCFLLRFTDELFTASFINTIGIDFRVKTFELDGKRIKLQIWDTAGQERFRTITTSYYRGAMGILLVYDTTDEESFKNLHNWIQAIDTNASENINKVLIGNKCDKVKEKVINTERGKALAEKYELKFFETSAKTGLKVEEAFLCITKDIRDRLIAEKGSPEISSNDSPKSKLTSPTSPISPTNLPTIPSTPHLPKQRCC